MDVQFYFDPSCPYSWITSRWLLEVSEHRDITISWHSFSLALKNDELSGNNTTQHADHHRISHSMLRVIEAVRSGEGESAVPRLYTALGKRFHNRSLKSLDILEPSLHDAGLPMSYATASQELSWDDILTASIRQAIAITGRDIGVPLIVFETENGPAGYFGPVLTALPQPDTGLKIWDSLVALAGASEFSELKRRRTGKAAIESTERLVSRIGYNNNHATTD